MRWNLQKSLASGLVVLLIGCATVENFEASVNSWLGADIQRLLDAWKTPDKTHTLQNGNSEYEYNIDKKYNKILPDTCVVFFEVDRNSQTIIHIRHEGNRCRRAPSFV
jgi:hypothetical protein